MALTPFNVTCFGADNGYIEFDVTPGANFDLPFAYTIKDSNDSLFFPNSLKKGNYTIEIRDADGCTLPIDSFVISEPTQIVATATTVEKTCDEGGQIQLTISGGNGGYRIDWADLARGEQPLKTAPIWMRESIMQWCMTVCSVRIPCLI